MFNLAGRGQKPGKPPSASHPASVERLFPLRLISLAKVVAFGCYRIWTLTDTRTLVLAPSVGKPTMGTVPGTFLLPVRLSLRRKIVPFQSSSLSGDLRAEVPFWCLEHLSTLTLVMLNKGTVTLRLEPSPVVASSRNHVIWICFALCFF